MFEIIVCAAPSKNLLNHTCMLYISTKTVMEHTHDYHFPKYCTLGTEASIEDIYHTRALCSQHNGILWVQTIECFHVELKWHDTFALKIKFKSGFIVTTYNEYHKNFSELISFKGELIKSLWH